MTNPEAGCWCQIDPLTCAVHHPPHPSPAHGHLVPISATADQVVEIHWRLPDGSIRLERHPVPAT